MSYKGVNWGKVVINDDNLSFTTLGQNHEIMNINFKQINNSTVNKNDIIIQTATDDVKNDDYVCEVRFHVQCPKQEQEMQVEGASENQNDIKKSHKFAQQLQKEIVQKAKIGQFAGDSIATLNQVYLSVPRGKYTVDFYQRNLRFHGPTFSYNIDYKNIIKGFILPMANQSQTYIALQLLKPIYQGQTVYLYVVLQIKKDTEVQVKTKLKPQYQKSSNLSKLKPQYNGPLYEVFIQLIKTCAQISLVAPGGQFKSKDAQPCVKCGVKAQTGWLYFLKKSMMFIPKPITYLKIDDIKKVQFNRLGATNKQFDLKLYLKSHSEKNKALSIEFSGIDRVQLQTMMEYFKARQVKIEKQQAMKVVPDVDDDEEDDDDFEADQQDESSSQSDEEQSQSKPVKEGEEKQ